MTRENDDIDAREQRERRRLARLVEALPAFSGFITPEGHISQSRPPTDEAFLWALPTFAYSPDSVTHIVDLCDRAAAGERIQIERQYLISPLVASSPDTPNKFGRGLLTLTPLLDDHDRVEEIAVSLIDCDIAGLPPRDEFAKSRLADANARIDTMLRLAQTVIERSAAMQGLAPASADARRDTRSHIANRLNALASVIDIVSDPVRIDISVEDLVAHCLQDIPPALRTHRLQIMTNGGLVPIRAVPVMTVLIAELTENAQRYGAWQNAQAEARTEAQGHVSIQSENLDTSEGPVLRLHWIEDGASGSLDVDRSGFGFYVAEQLFPELTGGTAKRQMSPDGLSWTFELPVADINDNFEFDGMTP